MANENVILSNILDEMRQLRQATEDAAPDPTPDPTPDTPPSRAREEARERAKKLRDAVKEGFGIAFKKTGLTKLNMIYKQIDELIKKAGIINQDKFFKKYLEIKKKITVKSGISEITLLPAKTFSLECSISFPFPIGKQKLSTTKPIEHFYNDILNARTFCFFEDIENMKEAGLAKGGSLENAIVIKENKILNRDGLRYENEFVKHKALDLIGDLALCNYNIIGAIKASCPGHEINKKIMVKLFSDFSNYQVLNNSANKNTSNIKKDNILASI